MTPGGALYALAILAAALAVGWLAYRTMAVRLLPAGSPKAASIAPGDPKVILDRAMIEFVTKRGALSGATMESIGSAALKAPLEARPYLFYGVRDLVRRDNSRALATLEAGRRLDPRQRWIRVLLLDRYLRAKRYREAAGEFAVLARLVGAASTPILAELARMSTDPSTRDAVRQTLATDFNLELALLTKLAQSGGDPRLIFSMASPRALAAASRPNGWGSALIDTMVKQRQFADARTVWKRIFHLSDAATSPPLYDAGLNGLPGSAPFNWSLAAGSPGAVDMRGGQLQVEYYGRDTGDLASQLMILRPGRYRLGFVLSGAPTNAETSLSWSVRCAGNEQAAPLLNTILPTVANTSRRQNLVFTVPNTGCPAQWLRLSGNSGEFPSPINAMVSGITLQPLETRS